MDTKDALEYFGNAVRLAETLKITPSAVYQWGGKVPRSRQYELHLLSNGELKIKSSNDSKAA